MADSTEEYVTPAAPPPETGEGSAALSADSSDEKCEASPPVPDADIADIVPRSTVDAAPTDAPSSMDAVLAEGAATQIKYSAAGGGPIVHPVPPMPTLEAALGPGFARPTHAWYGRLGVDTDVLEPYREASVRHGALESTLRKAPPTLGDGASGSAAPPSFLERAQRPRLRDRVEEYVGVAHARIQWEDPSDEDEGGAASRSERTATANPPTARGRASSAPRTRGTKGGSAPTAPKKAFCASCHASASQRSAPTPSAALGHRKPAPSARARAVPREAEEVLARDASALLEADGMSAALQVQGVIRSIEDELGELNLQYKRTVASLQRQAGGAPGAGGEEALHARIRGLVLRMEEKGAQLSSLRRTHTALTEKVDAVRDELLRTRGALQETAEAAAARWHRLRKLEQQDDGTAASVVGRPSTARAGTNARDHRAESTRQGAHQQHAAPTRVQHERSWR